MSRRLRVDATSAGRTLAVVIGMAIASAVTFAISGGPIQLVPFVGGGLFGVELTVLVTAWWVHRKPARAPTAEMAEAHLHLPSGASFRLPWNEDLGDQVQLHYPVEDAEHIARLLRMTAGYVESAPTDRDSLKEAP